MAHQCTFDPDASLVLCRFTGITTGAELAEACRECYGDGRWKSGMTAIVELSETDRLTIGPDELERLVETITGCRATYRPRRVLYSARRAEAFSAMQALSARIRRKGWETTVVHSLPEALDQIGLQELPPGLKGARRRREPALPDASSIARSRSSIDERSAGADAAARPCVLVIEDAPLLRRMAAHMLQREFEVEEAATAEEARNLLAERRYDVVLTDINLGGPVTGLDLLHEFRKRHPRAETAFIAMTSYTRHEREVFLQEGFRDFLAKPFTQLNLVMLIRSVLNPTDRMFTRERDEPENLAPYRFAFDRDAMLALCRYRWTITGTEMARSCLDMYRDPRWQPGMSVIVDMTELDHLLIDPDELNRFVDTVTTSRASGRPSRVFYVAPREDFRFVVQACAALLGRKGCRTAVMRSREEVLAELGLEELPPGLKAG